MQAAGAKQNGQAAEGQKERSDFCLIKEIRRVILIDIVIPSAAGGAARGGCRTCCTARPSAARRDLRWWWPRPGGPAQHDSKEQASARRARARVQWVWGCERKKGVLHPVSRRLLIRESQPGRQGTFHLVGIRLWGGNLPREHREGRTEDYRRSQGAVCAAAPAAARRHRRQQFQERSIGICG